MNDALCQKACKAGHTGFVGWDRNYQRVWCTVGPRGWSGRCSCKCPDQVDSQPSRPD